MNELITSKRYLMKKYLKKELKKYSGDIRGKILDVGCGDKPYQEMFNYKSYTGLDTHNSGHDHSNEPVDVIYDGKNIPFKNKSFDSIISFEVFEHVEKLDKVISEISRVLKKNGKLLISYPFIWPLHEEPYDFRRITPHGIKEMLEREDFKIIKSSKTSQNFSSYFQIKNLYLEEIYLKFKRPWRYLLIPFVIVNNILGILFSTIKTKKIYLGEIVLARKIK